MSPKELHKCLAEHGVDSAAEEHSELALHLCLFYHGVELLGDGGARLGRWLSSRLANHYHQHPRICGADVVAQLSQKLLKVLRLDEARRRNLLHSLIGPVQGKIRRLRVGLPLLGLCFPEANHAVTEGVKMLKSPAHRDKETSGRRTQKKV